MYRKSDISFTLIRRKKTGLSRAAKIGKNTPTSCEKSASSHFSICRSFWLRICCENTAAAVHLLTG
jgi:hypothetical protein